MAVIRNVAGEDRWIPTAGVIVDDNDTFEVLDDLFYSMHFGPDFEVVEPPPFPDPAIKVVQGEAADLDEAEAARQAEIAEKAARRAGVVAAQQAALAQVPDLEVGTYDPGAHGVDEVKHHLTLVDDVEALRIIEAERAGQARVTLVGKPADTATTGSQE